MLALPLASRSSQQRRTRDASQGRRAHVSRRRAALCVGRQAVEAGGEFAGDPWG